MRRLFLITLLVLPLPVMADQTDERLNDLFLQLKEAENERQAIPVDARIWNLWVAHDNPRFAGLMQRGIDQMNMGQARAALQTFSELVRIAPEYAEAWNKRATLHYYLGNYELSLADINETLKLEPFHYGALSGQGLVYMAQREYFRARNAFHAVLEIYPTMSSAKANLQALDEWLRDNAI